MVFGKKCKESFDVIIKPTKGAFNFDFVKDIWNYRELLFALAGREIKIRYQQTVLGVAWAVIQPVFTMIVFSVIFGRVAALTSEGVPYPVFTLAAIAPWGYFSRAFSGASESLVLQANLVSKVYFPRILIPLAVVLSGIVDFLIAFGILILIMLYYKIAPSVYVILLPVYVFLIIFLSFGISLWLGPLNVKYRDVKLIIPFLVQILFFLSPVVYSSALISGKFKYVYLLNPVTTIIDGFRASLLGLNKQFGLLQWISIAVILIIFFTGLSYFKKAEKTFADVI